MNATVIVLSYRPGDWLSASLASAAAQADEVILVDNGSEGALASELGRAAGVRVVRSRVNLGFAPAVAAAARLARGELIALLNDDATARPGWLASAAAALEDPEVAAVGPKLVLTGLFRQVCLTGPGWRAPGDPRLLGQRVSSVRVDGKECLERATGPGLHRLETAGAQRWRWTAGEACWYVPVPTVASAVSVNGEPLDPGPVVRLVNSAGLFLDHRGYSGDIGMGAPDDGRFDTACERFGVSGAAFVTRASTWRAVGEMAPRYFAYYEDVDWCWRALLLGYRVVYDPGAAVDHRRSASSGGEHRENVRVLAERNRTLTMVRNGPGPEVLRALRARLRGGSDGGVREAALAGLPWALASRASARSRWKLSPAEVWSRWAGVDSEWAV